jgi:CAAX prenyl protease-like protein
VEASPRDLIPYLVPMLAFLGVTSLEGYLPQGWYPAGYAAKVLVVAVLAWLCRTTWCDLKPAPSPAVATLAIMVGLIVFVLWIRLEGLYPALAFLGKRTGFDPSSLPGGWKWPFLAVRFTGLVLLVPLIEELFWRSFLIRWIIDPDFLKIPVGRVTPIAAAISSVAFALSHPEWLPALLTGLLWARLLWQTRSLSACVLSHAVANLALGLHVLATGEWKYW